MIKHGSYVSGIDAAEGDFITDKEHTQKEKNDAEYAEVESEDCG